MTKTGAKTEFKKIVKQMKQDFFIMADFESYNEVLNR